MYSTVSSTFSVAPSTRARERIGNASLSPSKPLAISASVDVSRLVLSTLRSIRSDEAVPLGSPYPDPSAFPYQRINQYANAIARRPGLWHGSEELPPGARTLIGQIAKRYASMFNMNDPTVVDRVTMLHIGERMIAAG